MDKYDEAIKYLTEHPDQIYSAWAEPWYYKGGCLFQYLKPVTDSRNAIVPDKSKTNYGCLTQIKAGVIFMGEVFIHELFKSPDPELTARIKADSRIPNSVDEITVESLPVFAEYQRIADATFRLTRTQD